MSDIDRTLNRGDFLKASGLMLGSAAFGLAAGMVKFEIGQGIVAGPPTTASPRSHLLLPTPSCGEPPTPAVSEGPFYAPSTPERTDLRPAKTGGRALRLAGRVLDTGCKPVGGAVLDFWQTDPGGVYDHFGYEFRGHQFTDREGRYELLTWLPASYSMLGVSRRRHIHVKIAAPEFRQLTSQLFFPFGEDARVEDMSFNRRLVTQIARHKGSRTEARYDFVIERI